MLLIGIVLGALASGFYTGMRSGDPDRFGSGLKQLLEVPRVDVERPMRALPDDQAQARAAAVSELAGGDLQQRLGQLKRCQDDAGLKSVPAIELAANLALRHANGIAANVRNRRRATKPSEHFVAGPSWL